MLDKSGKTSSPNIGNLEKLGSNHQLDRQPSAQDLNILFESLDNLIKNSFSSHGKGNDPAGDQDKKVTQIQVQLQEASKVLADNQQRLKKEKEKNKRLFETLQVFYSHV